MESFVAVYRRTALTPPIDGADWSRRVLASTMAEDRGSEMRSIVRSDADGLVICRQRERATDVFFGEVSGKLLYVQGCVEPRASLGSAECIRLAPDKILPRRLLSSGVEALEPVLCDLTGSYHLALADPEANNLVVVTDRLNSRPMFVYADPGYLAVASDVRAILALPQVDATIDLEAVAQFVRTQTLFGARTLYARISSLMPATLFAFHGRSGTTSSRSYWTLAPLQPFSSDHEAVEETAAAFRRAATRMTKAADHGGVLLSGGLDSRLILALSGRSTVDVRAYTFGPALTDEGEVARLVARTADVGWDLVVQQADDYWRHLPELLPALQGQYSIAHTHPFKTAKRMARDGIDTIFHGLELCVTFSGSYLPKNAYRVLHRQIYDYRLQPMETGADVKDGLLRALDVQDGRFARSYLHGSMQAIWRDAAAEAIAAAVEATAAVWPNPYDQYEKAILHAGFAKFRSYSVAASNRLVARERTVMPDADVIDAYRRLDVRQRFLGPVYRESFRALSPELATIVYSNVGTSPFASPAMQAIALQTRQLWRATVDRVSALRRRAGLAAGAPVRLYGSYPSPVDLVQALNRGDSPGAMAARRALVAGMLVQCGVVDGPRIDRRLRSAEPMSPNEATSLLALATLASWLDRYQGVVRL